MANNNKHTGPNVPALRFPEFSGEWSKDCLNEFLEVQPARNTQGIYSKDDVLSVSGDYGVVNQIQLLGRSFAGKDVSNYHIVRTNDIVYTKSPLKEFPYGIVKTNQGTAGIVSTLYAVYSAKSNTDPKFVEYYFSSKERTNKYFKPIVRIGAKHDMKIGNEEVLRNIVVFPSKQEQNKIQEFLRIIDERIATQSKIIEEQETLLRSLRHKIYSRVQAQSQCTIADVLCYEQPTKYLVTDTDYTDDDSQVPVLTANKAFILGYTTENFGIYDKGPCIILDDFTLDCKYVDFKFKVKSSAIKILRAKAKTNLRFIFEYFRFLDLNTTEHRRHYIAEIEPMSILLPSNEEIDRIARLFTALDERLEAARKVLKILESQKMYMLQKMFI